MKKKLIRVSTVPISLNILIEGQLRFLSKYYEVIGVSSPGIELDEVCKREGVRTIAVPMNRKISLFKDFVSLMNLLVLFYKEKPYIVHSITPKAGLLSMVAAKLAGVPIRIHTFTGLIFPTATGFKRKVLMLMDKLLAWCATEIIPEGEGVKKDLLYYGITKKKIQILGNGNVNGIDLAHFSLDSIHKSRSQIRQSVGFALEDFVFVFVGRVVRDKGINELIAAFKEMGDNRIKLLLVGNLEQALDPVSDETIEEINNNPRINFVGFQPDIREYLFASDVFVFPSYREGFPNVVMQAGAMGLPAIVTDINGSNEIIINERNGLIISVRDSKSLALAMKMMVEDGELRNRLSANARYLIETRYKQKLVWEELLKKYKLLESNL